MFRGLSLCCGGGFSLKKIIAKLGGSDFSRDFVKKQVCSSKFRRIFPTFKSVFSTDDEEEEQGQSAVCINVRIFRILREGKKIDFPRQV